jgi:hypothetical protein
VGGKHYPLTRKDVSRVLASVKSAAQIEVAPAKAGFHRINIEQFPKGAIEEAFEKEPTTGRALQIGENIEKLFISKGFVLSTTIGTSHVSVNNFAVEGKSRGLSAATHEPLWTGEITIKFVQPGQESLPAGVTHFGCYIAAVSPNGTALAAYDINGKELGKISTQMNGSEYLGVSSDVPIHTVRIIPNMAIDRDYTLDDFMFVPAVSARPAHPTRFTVLLGSGDVALCQDVTLAQGKVQLHGLPAGLPDMTLDMDEMERVILPRKEKTEPPEGMFAELKDGSILFAPRPKEPRKRPVFARRPELLADQKDLVGLWSTNYPRMPHTPTGQAAALWSDEGREWKSVTYVRLLEEVVLWKDGDGKFASAGYPKLPPLWFTAPLLKPQPGTWHVRGFHGEDLVLGKGQPLMGRLSEGLRAMWQGQEIRVPASELAAVYQVTKK